MSKKSSADAASKIAAVKKSEIYETKHQDLVEVVNGRLKDEGELGTSFEGRSITCQETTGRVVRAKTTDRYYLDDLVRKLSKSEYDDWIDAGRREAEAAAAALTQSTTDSSVRKPKSSETSARSDKTKKSAKSAGKTSALDAAAKVLSESGQPMTTKAMIEAMAAKEYWTSPGGQTPHATLYSAILREIITKGKKSRFQKTDRGQFTILK